LSRAGFDVALPLYIPVNLTRPSSALGRPLDTPPGRPRPLDTPPGRPRPEDTPPGQPSHQLLIFPGLESKYLDIIRKRNTAENHSL
jgi:hypothetical protein